MNGQGLSLMMFIVTGRIWSNSSINWSRWQSDLTFRVLPESQPSQSILSD